jgi:hypothetical protein
MANVRLPEPCPHRARGPASVGMPSRPSNRPLRRVRRIRHAFLGRPTGRVRAPSATTAMIEARPLFIDVEPELRPKLTKVPFRRGSTCEGEIARTPPDRTAGLAEHRVDVRERDVRYRGHRRIRFPEIRVPACAECRVWRARQEVAKARIDTTRRQVGALPSRGGRRGASTIAELGPPLCPDARQIKAPPRATKPRSRLGAEAVVPLPRFGKRRPLLDQRSIHRQQGKLGPFLTLNSTEFLQHSIGRFPAIETVLAGYVGKQARWPRTKIPSAPAFRTRAQRRDVAGTHLLRKFAQAINRKLRNPIPFIQLPRGNHLGNRYFCDA